MVTRQEVQRQLKAIGADFRFWGRAEVRELEHILVPSENIMYCLNGRYEGGFAMLCVTDQRIILVDKKPMYLTLEDLRYDMVSEVDFSQRLLDSSILVFTINKTLKFTTFRGAYLRKATAYIQQRVMQLRHMPELQPAAEYIQTPMQATVHSLEHKIVNPYTRMPLVMRRRLSRFYSG